MKVISFNKGTKFRLDRFPQEIKNGTLTYFEHGKGYKKTAHFTILEAELPDVWDRSWLEICKITEKYGMEVGVEYADTKVAGIIAMQMLKGYFSLYEKIKDILPENFDSFFEILRFDYMLSCFGLYLFDIVALDKKLGEVDPEYLDEEATYRGEKCSMSEYVCKKYGEDYNKVIERLLTK